MIETTDYDKEKTVVVGWDICLKIEDGRIQHHWPLDFVYNFCGFPVQQHPAAMLVYEKILSNNRDVKRIVEIGTGFGGLALFFAVSLYERGGKVLSIDYNKLLPRDELLELWNKLGNIEYHIADCYAGKTFRKINDFSKDERTLFFCDGPDKAREFKMITKIAKRNDLIMAHDYGFEYVRETIEINPKEVEMYNQEYFDMLKCGVLSCIKK